MCVCMWMCAREVCIMGIERNGRTPSHASLSLTPRNRLPPWRSANLRHFLNIIQTVSKKLSGHGAARHRPLCSARTHAIIRAPHLRLPPPPLLLLINYFLWLLLRHRRRRRSRGRSPVVGRRHVPGYIYVGKRVVLSNLHAQDFSPATNKKLKSSLSLSCAPALSLPLLARALFYS